MCFMDWRIGRLIRSVSRAIVTNTGGTIVLPANPQRVGVSVWFSNVSEGFSLIPDGVNNASATPPTAVAQLPIHITLATHGDLPTKSLTIQSASNGQDTISITEYFAPENVLTLGLELLQKQYPGLF